MRLRPVLLAAAVAALACGSGGPAIQLPAQQPEAPGPVPRWVLQPSGTTSTLVSVWGSSARDVWAVGHGSVLHHDGATWTRDPGRTEELMAVWGSSATDVFAVGQGGVILHRDANGWTAQESGTTEGLSGVWGSGPTDVYAVGDHGTILHYDGVRWSPQASGTTNPLYDVWGSGPDDVFAVDGFAGTILHFDGAGWSAQRTEPPFRGVTGIWGFSPTDVYAAAGNDLLRYDGVAWSTFATGNMTLRAVGGGTRSAFVVGMLGVVARYDGSAWGVDPRATGQNLWDVWGSDEGAFAVGDGGTILRYTPADD